MIAERGWGAKVRAAHREHVARWRDDPTVWGADDIVLDLPATDMATAVRGDVADRNPNITHYATNLTDLDDDYYGDVFG